MKFEPAEFPVFDIDRTTRAERPGVFLYLAGSSHLVGEGSAREAWLLECGAIPVARLSFRRDPYEARHQDREVDVLRLGTAARVFLDETPN